LYLEVVTPYKKKPKQKLLAELHIGGRRARNRGLLRVEKLLREKKKKNVNEIDGTGD
jgi:hypothetical protein